MPARRWGAAALLAEAATQPEVERPRQDAEAVGVLVVVGEHLVRRPPQEAPEPLIGRAPDRGLAAGRSENLIVPAENCDDAERLARPDRGHGAGGGAGRRRRRLALRIEDDHEV